MYSVPNQKRPLYSLFYLQFIETKTKNVVICCLKIIMETDLQL